VTKEQRWKWVPADRRKWGWLLVTWQDTVKKTLRKEDWLGRKQCQWQPMGETDRPMCFSWEGLRS